MGKVFYISKKYALLVSWLLIAIFVAISTLGIIFPSMDFWSARITNRNYNNEGLIESIENLCWFLSLIIYFCTTLKIFKIGGSWLSKSSFVFFVIFCFVALGEEMSWGQHFLNYKVVDSYINYQGETNLHNLNISELVGLSKNNVFYKLLQNFTRVLNPLFYLICISLWVVFPIMKKKQKNRSDWFIYYFPELSNGTIYFCGANALFYLVVDKLFFDVGEIFELALALTAFMSALDAYKNIQDRIMHLRENKHEFN